jgi:hypothetical protein
VRARDDHEPDDEGDDDHVVGDSRLQREEKVRSVTFTLGDIAMCVIAIVLVIALFAGWNI